MDAQNAWLKHDQAHAHPFNAGILYNIGVCCLEQKKISASMSGTFPKFNVTSTSYFRILILAIVNFLKTL
jgi:hypothetical protein